MTARLFFQAFFKFFAGLLLVGLLLFLPKEAHKGSSLLVGEKDRTFTETSGIILFDPKGIGLSLHR